MNNPRVCGRFNHASLPTSASLQGSLHVRNRTVGIRLSFFFRIIGKRTAVNDSMMDAASSGCCQPAISPDHVAQHDSADDSWADGSQASVRFADFNLREDLTVTCRGLILITDIDSSVLHFANHDRLEWRAS